MKTCSLFRTMWDYTRGESPLHFWVLFMFGACEAWVYDGSSEAVTGSSISYLPV
jgi:hypothetical protein